MSDRIITRAELAKHNNQKDGRWILIGNDVLDISTFHVMHPGGSKILTDLGGTDATEKFWALHKQEILLNWAPRLKVGTIEDAEAEEIDSLGAISNVPFAEHTADIGNDTPYYNDSHIDFRQDVRDWVYTALFRSGIAEKHESNGERPPDSLFEEMGRKGILAARLGPGKHLKVWQEKVMHDSNATIFGVKPEEFDYFHERILHEEIVRCACPGFVAGIGDGHCIGAPPIFQFGPAWMQDEVLPQVLAGKKRICLAISEPQAGSDVANLTTLGKRLSDGSFVVSGTKKWITQGHHADYFVVAVRTGPSGMAGLSILLLDRSMDGLRTKPIKTAYSPAAGTALIIMENVKVPARNLIGQYQQGFKAVMYNFNHERWFINCVALSTTRSIIEETFKWIMQRKAFGKRLADQGVVRLMMAQMIGAIEPCVHWLDSITYQMNNMSYDEQALRLAGTTSLCKYQITRVANMVADKCTQLFGGRGITQTGMGRYAERFNRVYKFAAILGGSEEVMADLAIRMAMKQFPSEARL